MYVILDAGHNEHIAGKRSPDKTLLEYEFNYDVAQKTQKHLLRCGIAAEVMQMDTASAVEDVELRIKYANEKKADLLVSIHANAAGTAGWYTGKDGRMWNTAHGWEIYCYEPDKHNGESYKLAEAIHSESMKLLNLTDRGIKDGKYLGVVARTTMPAVLVEHAFYTNENECELLKSQEFRDRCALADAGGICKYLGMSLDGKTQDEIVKERFGLNDETMEYLINYRYSEDLLKRLATKE